jgi:hypothetical protein
MHSKRRPAITRRILKANRSTTGNEPVIPRGQTLTADLEVPAVPALLDIPTGTAESTTWTLVVVVQRSALCTGI